MLLLLSDFNFVLGPVLFLLGTVEWKNFEI